ncbi:MAG: type II toxin-antitoxin system VapC family toxin [Rhodocyclaceae bacterium]
MILFLDAGACIKLYVAEAGSGLVRRSVRNATAVFALDLAYVEVCGAFAQAAKSGLLRTKDAEVAQADFDRDWLNMNVVAPDAAMLRRAAQFSAADFLPASAALNLAAAEGIQRQLGRAVPLRVCLADPRTAGIAAGLGLPLLDLSAGGEAAPD